MRDCKWRDTEGICVIDCKLCDECKNPLYMDTDCLYKFPVTPSELADSIEKSMQCDCIYCERGNCELSGLGCIGKECSLYDDGIAAIDPFERGGANK